MSAQSIGPLGETRESEASQLKHLLARFAQDAVPRGARPNRRFHGYNALIEGIFREIDETVLPRQITIECDSEIKAHLMVSNRRLIGLESPGLVDLEQKAPAKDPEAAATWYVDRLQLLFENCSYATCRVTAHIPSSMGSRISCSPYMLARAAGLDLAPKSTELSEDEWFSDLQGLATAWIRSDANSTERDVQGRDELIEMLRKIASAQLRSGGRSAKFRSNQPNCIILKINAEIGVAILQGDNEILLAVLPSDRIDLAVDLINRP
jgi:hypothetical protein